MWTNLDWVRLAALACILRGCYEASRTDRGRPGAELARLPQTRSGGCICNLTGAKRGANVDTCVEPPLPPQAGEWMRKELRRCRETQERRWRNWAKSLSR